MDARILAAETSATPSLSLTTNGRHLRLATLMGLRWLAIAGQTASVLVVHYALDFSLPLALSLLVIGLSAVLNMGLQWRFGTAFRPSNTMVGLLLAFDSLQLGGLLWLTGGLENPFAILLLAPVSVSASALTQRATWAIASLAALIICVLAVSHWPLPWDSRHPVKFDGVYITGIWAALLLGVAFISVYINRVASDARLLADALGATELALSRQQKLHALDGLAAAAAHELGTPLSTIALAAKEMRAEQPPGAIADDLDLILDQIVRCRAILGKLRSLDGEADDPFAVVPLGELLAEVIQPYEVSGKSILFDVQPRGGEEPVFARHVGLLYGLGNLVENAVYFARSKVSIVTRWDENFVTLVIGDDGPGFPPELITRLGEPYLTTRSRDEIGAESGDHMGLGLGIFISKTLLERTGATLKFFNRDGETHAEILIRWPRAAINALNPAG